MPNSMEEPSQPNNLPFSAAEPVARESTNIQAVLERKAGRKLHDKIVALLFKFEPPKKPNWPKISDMLEGYLANYLKEPGPETIGPSDIYSRIKGILTEYQTLGEATGKTSGKNGLNFEDFKQRIFACFEFEPAIPAKEETAEMGVDQPEPAQPEIESQTLMPPAEEPVLEDSRPENPAIVKPAPENLSVEPTPLPPPASTNFILNKAAEPISPQQEQSGPDKPFEFGIDLNREADAKRGVFKRVAEWFKSAPEEDKKQLRDAVATAGITAAYKTFASLAGVKLLTDGYLMLIKKIQDRAGQHTETSGGDLYDFFEDKRAKKELTDMAVEFFGYAVKQAETGEVDAEPDGEAPEHFKSALDQRAQELEAKINASKNITPEKKKNLLEQINGKIAEYQEGTADVKAKTKDEVARLTDTYFQQRVSKWVIAKDALNLGLTLTGMQAVRMAMYGITSAGERAAKGLQKFSITQAEGAAESGKWSYVFKDATLTAAKETMRGLSFTSDKKGLWKLTDFAQSAGVVARTLGIAGAGIAEWTDNGASTFSGAGFQHFIEAVEKKGLSSAEEENMGRGFEAYYHMAHPSEYLHRVFGGETAVDDDAEELARVKQMADDELADLRSGKLNTGLSTGIDTEQQAVSEAPNAWTEAMAKRTSADAAGDGVLSRNAEAVPGPNETLSMAETPSAEQTIAETTPESTPSTTAATLENNHAFMEKLFGLKIPAEAGVLESRGTVPEGGNISDMLGRLPKDNKVTVINPDNGVIKDFDADLVHPGDAILTNENGDVYVLKSSGVTVKEGMEFEPKIKGTEAKPSVEAKQPEIVKAEQPSLEKPKAEPIEVEPGEKKPPVEINVAESVPNASTQQAIDEARLAELRSQLKSMEQKQTVLEANWTVLEHNREELLSAPLSEQDLASAQTQFKQELSRFGPLIENAQFDRAIKLVDSIDQSAIAHSLLSKGVDPNQIAGALELTHKMNLSFKIEEPIARLVASADFHKNFLLKDFHEEIESLFGPGVSAYSVSLGTGRASVVFEGLKGVGDEQLDLTIHLENPTSPTITYFESSELTKEIGPLNLDEINLIQISKVLSPEVGLEPQETKP